MECNNWLSTDSDLVDGLPSYHLSLVSAGRQPIFFMDATKEPSGFHLGLKKLLKLMQPQINGILLPEIGGLLNSTSIAISDTFICRNGQNVCVELTSNGISAHYDVFSIVAAVIALDEISKEGTNDLFTTYFPEQGTISDHSPLRRLFTLESGDDIV